MKDITKLLPENMTIIRKKGDSTRYQYTAIKAVKKWFRADKVPYKLELCHVVTPLVVGGTSNGSEVRKDNPILQIKEMEEGRVSHAIINTGPIEEFILTQFTTYERIKYDRYDIHFFVLLLVLSFIDSFNADPRQDRIRYCLEQSRTSPDVDFRPRLSRIILEILTGKSHMRFSISGVRTICDRLRLEEKHSLMTMVYKMLTEHLLY